MSVTYDSTDWERLADRVITRREYLGKTQIEVAQDGGLSLDRVSAIELAKSTQYRSKTLRALERGLEWSPRSVDTVLAGGEPTPIGGPGRRSADDMAAFRAETEAAWERIKSDPEKLRRFRQALPLIEGDPEEPPPRDERRSEAG